MGLSFVHVFVSTQSSLFSFAVGDEKNEVLSFDKEALREVSNQMKMSDCSAALRSFHATGRCCRRGSFVFDIDAHFVPGVTVPSQSDDLRTAMPLNQNQEVYGS